MLCRLLEIPIDTRNMANKRGHKPRKFLQCTPKPQTKSLPQVRFEHFAARRFNATSHDAERALRQPMAALDDGYWTLPYYDCGGGDIWMVTYSAPIFGFDTNFVPVFRFVELVQIC